MIDPSASLIRDGRRVTIAADRVVPGDIVLLEDGDRVPADVRLVKARNLRIDEAILTGESVPLDKAVKAVDASAALGDRLPMAFSGTFVTAGEAVRAAAGCAWHGQRAEAGTGSAGKEDGGGPGSGAA